MIREEVITMKSNLKLFDIICFCISLLCGAYLLTTQDNPQRQLTTGKSVSYSSYAEKTIS
jgi:hypothetical protein